MFFTHKYLKVVQKMMKERGLGKFGFPQNFSTSSKNDVFIFLLELNTDKSGYLLKESGFKKYFPDLYVEYLNTQFPEESNCWDFKQKLWHFLQDDVRLSLGKCVNCNRRVKFKRFKVGYFKYCCRHCFDTHLDRLEHIKNIWKNKTPEEIAVHVDRNKMSKLRKHGDENYNNISKCRETKQERYGDKNYNNRNKAKVTCQEKYGCDNWVESKSFKQSKDEWLTKAYHTKSTNNTWHTTSIEKRFEQYLIDGKIDYKSQYSDDTRYPFNCDFYLPDYDLFVEIQGYWTHGNHPFDESNQEDINILNGWLEKSNNNQYDAAIINWTKRDVEKRNVAKNNKLNFLEVFSNDITEAIQIFETYIQKNF